MDELTVDGQNNQYTRRVRDLVIAILAFLLLWPLMIVIGLAVLLFSGDPILYRERRVSRGDGLFTMYKFRTMRTGVKYCNHIAPDNDERITGVGLWLRRRRLDELPQLFNILRGDMSLVGPRPMPPEHAAAIPDSSRQRILSVRPGITGRAALAFLAEDYCLAEVPDFEKVYLEKLLPAKIRHELQYLEDPDSFKDWRILWETLTTIWSSQARQRSEQLVRSLLNTD